MMDNILEMLGINVENYARNSDPDTCHKAAAKAKKRHLELIDFCDGRKRYGCTNDEFCADEDAKRQAAVEEAKRKGEEPKVQRNSMMTDQTSNVPSKLVQGGIALYTNERRTSRRGGEQMVLVMIRFLTLNEIIDFMELKPNRKFGSSIATVDWKNVPAEVNEQSLAALRVVIPNKVKEYEAQQAEADAVRELKKKLKEGDFPDWMKGGFK